MNNEFRYRWMYVGYRWLPHVGFKKVYRQVYFGIIPRGLHVQA